MKKITENKKIVGLFIVLILLVVFSFWVGTKFGSRRSSPIGGQFSTMNQGRFSGMSRLNKTLGNSISGQILTNDGKSLTLKLRDGGSRIVLLPASVGVQKMASGTPSDLTVGAEVSVVGQTNQDGSVTGQTIQVRPSVPSGMMNQGAPTGDAETIPTPAQ